MNTWEMSGQDDLRDANAQGAGSHPEESALHQALADVYPLLGEIATTGEPTPFDVEVASRALSVVAEKAEEAQFLALTDVALRIAERLATTPEARVLLRQFLQAASDYLGNPSEPFAQDGLVACLQSEAFGEVPSVEELDILRLMLGMSLDESGDAHVRRDDDAAPDTPAPQRVDAAVLAMFADEARSVLATFDDLLVAAMDADAETRARLVEAALGELESLARGAEYSGLAALATLLEHSHRIVAQAHLGAGCEDFFRSLQLFSAALAQYLSQPTDVDAAGRLVAVVYALGPDDALVPDGPGASVIAALAAVEVVTTASVGESRPVQAQPGDISLDLPEDINPELLEGLLLELPIQTGAFAHAVQNIVDGRGTREDIDVAKRAAHTLKGAANTVGVRGVASLTHYLEDILVALSEQGVMPNLGLSQTLSYAADCLEAMSEALIGSGASPDDALNVLQDVLNWANRIDAQGIDVARGEAPVERESANEHPQETHAAGREQPTAMLRVPARVIDELLRLVGEAMTSTAQLQNRVAVTMQQARAISRQNALLQQLVSELETTVDLRGLHTTGTLAPVGSATGEFDALEFEEYNELQTLSRRLIEVATDSREMGAVVEEHLAGLDDMLEQQGRLHRETQTTVLITRMVQVGSVFSRLQRSVRQACRILDKQVDLRLDGSDTVIDGNILHELVDVLMHLLRNAVDHGIEPADQRIAAGKPASGTIDLSFRREGDYITVRCADDGRGLDLAAIRAEAERRGLVAPDSGLSDDETARLILIHGFSTRNEATQVSGRGIGMDAVNSKVAQFKGLLNLESHAGSGLTVEIRLPVTLLSTHALMVRAGGKVLAISNRGVADILFIPSGSREQLCEELAALTEGRLDDVAELETVLNLPQDRNPKSRHGWPVIIARLPSGAERALAVGEVFESRNLLVKTLGRYVPKVQGIIGATILGDGSVAPVIDLPDLLFAPMKGLVPAEWAEAQDADEGEASRPRLALVVDDSISARRAMVQVLSDAGYEVRAAVDGLDAVALLEQQIPDVMVTDMEMPRMNGFELIQHVRTREASRHLPVVMVTSRSTEKHRRQAELAGVSVYLTKPFNEHELINIVESLVQQRQVPTGNAEFRGLALQ